LSVTSIVAVWRLSLQHSKSGNEALGRVRRGIFPSFLLRWDIYVGYFPRVYLPFLFTSLQQFYSVLEAFIPAHIQWNFVQRNFVQRYFVQWNFVQWNFVQRYFLQRYFVISCCLQWRGSQRNATSNFGEVLVQVNSSALVPLTAWSSYIEHNLKYSKLHADFTEL
jgi:hypothetical protein